VPFAGLGGTIFVAFIGSVLLLLLIGATRRGRRRGA
jgi:hypothetical protein